MQLKNELYQISCLDFLLGSAGFLRSEHVAVVNCRVHSGGDYLVLI